LWRPSNNEASAVRSQASNAAVLAEGFAREAHRRAGRAESMLVSEEPEAAGLLRCYEIHRACRRGGCAVRCLATGRLWSGGRPGIFEISLEGGLVAAMQQLAAARGKVQREPLLPEIGFSALCRKVGCDPPGDRGALVRIGGTPEMPLAAIRGSWGFDKARLCAVDAQGVVFPAAAVEPHVAASEPLDASSEWRRSVRRRFLAGELGARPAVVASRAAVEGDSARSEEAPARLLLEPQHLPGKGWEDPRHVLWLPGQREQASELLQRSLGELKRKQEQTALEGQA